jgi:quercetin dioxygenase-like cupin family protein
MTQRGSIAVAVFVGGLALGVLGARALDAREPSGARWTELRRVDLPGLHGKEAIVALADIPRGARPGRHTHPGHEFFFVIEGSMTWAEDGAAPIVLKPGDVAYQPAGHVAEARDVTEPVTAVVFMIHEKGQPIRIAVE